MTTTVLLLVGPLVILLAALGLALWHLSRRPEGEVDLSALAKPPAQETYRPMRRLFAEQDMRFLADQRGCTPGMQRRLRRHRRKALALYLKQIRTDFSQVWRICRLLAQISPNPNFGWLITKQFLLFYSLYAALQVRSFLGLAVPVRVDAFDLVTALQRLQQGARSAMTALQPGIQASA